MSRRFDPILKIAFTEYFFIFFFNTTPNTTSPQRNYFKLIKPYLRYDNITLSLNICAKYLKRHHHTHQPSVRPADVLKIYVVRNSFTLHVIYRSDVNLSSIVLCSYFEIQRPFLPLARESWCHPHNVYAPRNTTFPLHNLL